MANGINFSYGFSDRNYESTPGHLLTGNITNAGYDAAMANWSSGWRMPTVDECKTLINEDWSNKTTTQRTTRNGVYGLLITGKGSYSNNSIFLPAAGYGMSLNLEQSGTSGYYWTSSYHNEEYEHVLYEALLRLPYMSCKEITTIDIK